MKNIMFLITGFDHAGAENQVVQLCRALTKRGYLIMLLIMVEPTAAAYVEELQSLGVEVHSLHMRKGIPDPRAIVWLSGYIRGFRPNILHSHMVHANLLARVTRLFTRIPRLICTAHSIDEGGRIRTLLYRITDPLCDVMTNVSQEAVNRYIAIRAAPRGKILFMPNGIQVDQFRSTAEERQRLRGELGVQDQFVWLAAGRLAPEKDYETMLRAFAMLQRDHPHHRLLIAGAGPEQTKLTALQHQLGLDDAVQFLGIRSDIPQLMGAADAYLMSSRWEGLPMVLLEASACGLPIVTTDVGGNREVVVEGVNGCLVEPMNPDQLSEAMIRLGSLPQEQLLQIGRAGREYVELRFNINTIVERWESLYEQEKQQSLSS